MEDSDDDDKKGDDKEKLSKKKLKKQSRLTVAELKQIVERPDLVEMHDVTCKILSPKFGAQTFYTLSFSHGSEASCPPKIWP